MWPPGAPRVRARRRAPQLPPAHGEGSGIDTPVLATIPVGLAGEAFQQGFQTFFGHPRYAAVFLAINGLILLAGERLRTLTPFGTYCLLAGVASFVYLGVIQ